MPSFAVICPPGFRRTLPISSTVVSLLPIWASIIACFLSSHCSSAYSPDVNHRAIAGLWKLKQTPMPSSIPYPLKEFTVYPKVPKERNSNDNDNDNDNNNNKEVLLMLNEDGSFQQYSNEEQMIPDKLRFFNNNKTNKKAEDNAVLDRYCEFGKLKGKWNLVGGKLILAADRPIDDDNDKPSSSSSSSKTKDYITDTILEGEVVATSEEGLLDNPVLSSHKDDSQSHDSSSSNNSPNSNSPSSNHESKSGASSGNPNNNAKNRGSSSSSSSSSTSSSSKSVLDTHLSVPKGQVNVGRFTYPTHHPSFFDAPMFNPRAGGKFELKQVLGSLNTRQTKDDEEFEEKFSPSDFYNKTFLLTTHPVPEFRPKGNIRWSIKYNKFVEDPPKNSKKKDDERLLDQPVHNIRVLEVKFFANNTFATIGGMGGSAILRGRFSVIGKEKDHIWLQVIRFGFGRSVSGSVFSEGKSLSNDDEKAYWGKIEYVDDDDQDDDAAEGDEEKSEGIDDSSPTNPIISEQNVDAVDTKKDVDRRLLVKGSVLFGYGLEPMPVGLFVLTETNSKEVYDSDDDEEEEDEDDDDDEDDNDDFNDDQFFLDSDNIFQ